MKKSQNKRKMDGSGSLLLSIIIVFGILGAIVFSVAHKISVEMSASAIQNLSESLDLIESTIEAVNTPDTALRIADHWRQIRSSISAPIRRVRQW